MRDQSLHHFQGDSGLPRGTFHRLADEHGVPCLGDIVERSDLKAALRSPWFTEAVQRRLAEEAERARALAERAERARLRAELDMAERAPIPPGEAASLLGVDEALCVQYARSWSLLTVAQAQAAASAADVPVTDYLDLELAERRCQSDEAKRRQAQQFASWRSAWASELGLPAHTLDATSVPRYNRANRREVYKWKRNGGTKGSAPAWLRAILWPRDISTAESAARGDQVLSRPVGFPRPLWRRVVLPALEAAREADREHLRSVALATWEVNQREPMTTLERVVERAMSGHRADPDDAQEQP